MASRLLEQYNDISHIFLIFAGFLELRNKCLWPSALILFWRYSNILERRDCPVCNGLSEVHKRPFTDSEGRFFT